MKMLQCVFRSTASVCLTVYGPFFAVGFVVGFLLTFHFISEIRKQE